MRRQGTEANPNPNEKETLIILTCPALPSHLTGPDTTEEHRHLFSATARPEPHDQATSKIPEPALSDPLPISQRQKITRRLGAERARAATSEPLVVLPAGNGGSERTCKRGAV